MSEQMQPAILAEFAAAATGAEVKGDVVVRKAPVVFRAGTYEFDGAEPYVMTPEEIREVCVNFEPVPIVDTHVPSHFNAKLGDARITRLLPSEDYGHFGAEAEVPRWFHDLFGDEPLGMSATFDRETKRLKNVALVPNPRISDAALFAAFAAESKKAGEEEEKKGKEKKPTPAGTPHGLARLQAVHDMAAQGGAVCGRQGDANFTAPQEYSALQAAHDAAAKGGAKCSTTKPTEAAMSADGTGAATATPAPPPAQAPAQASAREIELEARVKALEAQREVDRQAAFAAQVKAIEAEAASFAREQVLAGRAFPAQRQDVADDYRQAALDDLTHKAEVTFSAEDGKTRQKGGRLDALRARWRRTPAHRLREEVVTDGRLAAVFAEETPNTEADEEKEAKRLLLLTPLGAQMARESAQKNGKE